LAYNPSTMGRHQLDQIEHIVVLMLENRSFDNILGWEHGLSTSDCNRYAPTPGDSLTTACCYHDRGTSFDTMIKPCPDPGELFNSMNQQIFGLVERPSVFDPAPSRVGELGEMGGFAQNYAFIINNGDTPDSGPDGCRGRAAVPNIMHAFSAEQVPVSVALAKAFTAIDTYHASAPCQTLPNRCFAQLGSAKGFVNNKAYFDNGTSVPHLPYFGDSIFGLISQHDASLPTSEKLGWRVYFGDFPLTLFMWDVLEPCLVNGKDFRREHFRFFDAFASDVASGELPAYTWIEPRYQIAPNDNHPPHDVTLGEKLVAETYNTLRANEDLWKKTLLIVTYDEHGGCYDRVFPGKAPAPGPPYPDGFEFDRYGVRVPTMVCSPWIPSSRGKTGGAPATYDHTSILRTVRERFSIEGNLGDREKVAASLEVFLTNDAPSNLGPAELTLSTVESSKDVDEVENDIQELIQVFCRLMQDGAEKFEDNRKQMLDGALPVELDGPSARLRETMTAFLE